MKNYVGRKIKGFRGCYVESLTKDIIGKTGIIVSQEILLDPLGEIVTVDFYNKSLSYPISLIEPHLIEEESPEIIDLSNVKGVEMMVKDQRDDTPRKVIIKATVNNRFIDWCGNAWYYAEPIPQLPKYTHAELVEKIGHDFEII
jgi:hypothetical protein